MDEPLRLLRIFIGVLLSALLVAVVALAILMGPHRPGRWCEHDATDRVVSDSYCRAGHPGYEWETE